MKKFVIKLSIGLALGIIPTIWILQNNYLAKKVVLNSLIQTLEKKWNASITIEKTYINIFTGIINLINLEIISKNKIGCTWKTKQGKIKILKRKSLLDKRFNLAITLNENNVETDLKNNTLGIIKLLQNIFKIESPHFNAQSFLLNNAIIHLKNNTQKPSLHIQGFILAKKDNNKLWHGRLSLTNGFIRLQKDSDIREIKGQTYFHETNNTDTPLTIKMNHSFTSNYLKNPCSISGTWNKKTKYITCTNKNESIDISITPTHKNISLQGNINLKKAINQHSLNKTMQKFCKKKCRIESTISNNPGPMVTTSIKAYDSSANTNPIDNIVVQAEKINDFLKANFNCSHKNTSIKGSAHWNAKENKGSLLLYNKSPISLFTENTITIPKKHLTISATINKNLQINGKYKTTLHNEQTKNNSLVKGIFQIDSPSLTITGSSSFCDYLIKGNLKEKIPITKCIVTKNNKTKIYMENKNNSLEGKVQYAFIQSFFPFSLRKLILGNKGTILLKLTPKNNHIIGNISLEKSKIHIPGSYNIIKNITTNFDFSLPTKTLLLKDLIVNFQKGTMSCQYATILWENNIPTFIHAPIQIKNFLINWKEDFFGYISGNIFAKKTNSNPLSIIGDIIIEKSLLKENIFSQNLESNITYKNILPLIQENPEFHVDINIINKNNLVVKTPMLQTNASLNIRVQLTGLQNMSYTKEITGSVLLQNGSIIFPKNKLFISSGKIHFMPNKTNDPMINLTAKNRIKKYLITLHVTGFLQKPTIFLESNPELTEEQILSLMFAGSEKVSLHSDFPSIIMQNLNTLILGNKKLLPTAKGFFKTITQPLKYVQITPNFTDQSGRGGVKGTLSIDVNKQIHAHIQKNFTLQDDLAFSLEYFLSDNINIKAIKDYRNDIGAEVEFVLKP